MTRGAAPTLRGVRRCIRCGYRLSGQPIVRHEELAIFLARCPECGVAAVLGDSPFLPRPAPWARVAAIAWAVVAAAALLGTIASMGIEARLAVEVASQRYVSLLSARYQAAPHDETPLGRGLGVLRSRQPVSEWWAAQDHAALLDSAGGWLGAIDWQVLVLMLPVLLTAAAWGAFWAVALAAHRVRRWMMVAVIMVLVAATHVPDVLLWRSGELRSVTQVAASQMAPVVLPAVLLMHAAALTAGVVIGRAAARLFLRLALPARLRRSFRPLWVDAPTSARV